MRIRAVRALHIGVLVLCVFVCIAGIRAQSPAKDSGRLAELKFTGLSHFSSEQLSNAIGLHVGDHVSSDRLDAAAALLAKSGAFDNVNFRYASEGGALKAEFRVVETQKLLPCLFDNFIWFSDEQIDHTLRSRVDFYAGVVPESGDTAEQVRLALRDMLRANGIAGDVDKVAHVEGIGRPISRFDFHVTGIPMPVRNLSFPGASAISEGTLRAASKELIGRDFSISGVSAFAGAGLLPLYRRQGYLRARFDAPRFEIIGGAANAAQPEISVTLPVTEGIEFLWSKADWTGNHVFSVADLDHFLGMKPREVANQEKLDAGLQAVAKAYQKRGFVDATVRNQLILEDSDQTASCEVIIDEGTQYRMGKVTFAGLTERASKEVTNGWKLKSGDIYDGTYSADFLTQVAGPTLLKNGVKNMRSSMKLERDKQNAIVNLIIVFQ